MTIDEAIAHAREKADKQRADNDNCVYKSDYGCKGCADYYTKPCKECAKEHEQLAEWLEELKERRESNFDYVQLMDSRYKEGYNKGLSAAWNLAFKLFGEEQEILVKLFGTDEVDEIISWNRPQEVMAKYGEYERGGAE